MSFDSLLRKLLIHFLFLNWVNGRCDKLERLFLIKHNWELVLAASLWLIFCLTAFVFMANSREYSGYILMTSGGLFFQLSLNDNATLQLFIVGETWGGKWSLFVWVSISRFP